MDAEAGTWRLDCTSDGLTDGGQGAGVFHGGMGDRRVGGGGDQEHTECDNRTGVVQQVSD